MLYLTLFFISLALLVGKANAQEEVLDTLPALDLEIDNYGHAYVGARGGLSVIDKPCGKDSFFCSDDSFVYGFYTGYKFAPWFALEVSLTDYGSFDASYEKGNIRADIWSSDLTGVFSFQFSDRLSSYIKAGFSYQFIDREVFSQSQHFNDLKFASGVGLEYKMSESWSVRAEYQFTGGPANQDTFQTNIHFASLGIAYHFAKPRTHISADIPAKRFISEKKGVQVSKDVSLHLNILFEFNSSVVRENPQLSSLINELSQLQKGTIYITGHSDSLGTTRYNQWLSERRAHALADYMIDNGVNPSLIIVKGEGELFPTASNLTVKGRQQNRRAVVSFNQKVISDLADKALLNKNEESK